MVDRIQTLWLDIARYQPLRGGSYIPLPAAVRSKKAVINVKNRDDHCLRWALRAALAYPPPPHNPERLRWYPTEDGLNFQGIDAPTPISEIQKVEKQNNLAINVFGWDKGVTIHRLSKQPQEIPGINMLLIEKGGQISLHLDKRNSTASSAIKASTGSASTFASAVSMATLESHRAECRGIGQTAVQVEMPEKGKSKRTFQNYHKQLPAPYIICADFEALTTKVEGLSSTPQRATLRGHNTMRLVVTATSGCGVMVRQSQQSNTAAPMQQSTSKNHYRKKRAKSRVC